MSLATIATISFTLAFLVGGAGAAMIDRQVLRDGAASVTEDHLGAKLLMRVCPRALVAATLVTAGAALASLGA